MGKCTKFSKKQIEHSVLKMMKHWDFVNFLFSLWWQTPTTSKHDCQFVSVTFSMQNLSTPWQISCQMRFLWNWLLWQVLKPLECHWGICWACIYYNCWHGIAFFPSCGVYLHWSQDLNHHVTLLSACHFGVQRAFLLDKCVISAQNLMNKTTK